MRVLKKLKKGNKKENIKFLLQYGQCMYFDLDTLYKLQNQLKILTPDVKEDDEQIEKFAKIALAIEKNLSYAHTKTKSRNIGEIGNLIEGLLKGKCVCSGYTLIGKIDLSKEDNEKRHFDGII